MNLEDTYEHYVDAVYKFFYIKCLDRHYAEDLTSQTFIAVAEKMQDPDYVINDTKKFVYGVMRNIWLVYLREKYKHQETAVQDMHDFAAFVEEEVAEYESMTVKQRAEQYINQLPEKQRDVLTMRLLEGMTTKDICASTGHNSNYVKTTYKRGLKRLKLLIEMNEMSEAAGQEAL
jgi:RNA polymerase sigma-70 factor (ECF subfamily)